MSNMRRFVAGDTLTHVPTIAALARRTLVSVEVLEDVQEFLRAWPRPPADDPKRPDPLRKPGTVTVLTALLELQAKGFVLEIEQVAGGFWVRMKTMEAVA